MIIKGQKINDRYQIIRNIGEGGMANVYLAHDIILNRDVAVKVLRGDLSDDDKFIKRFEREAVAASSLSHPNIVEIYDVGCEDGNHYIVMEYVEGKTLKELIKKRGALTVSEVIDIMLQLTDGLACAHDSYIIHRDIKPQNILILDDGLVKITDFGIATASNSTNLTQTNSVMGSVHYLPPEQASGKGSTIKSDIYSLGILMYELLSGKVPFRGENAVEIALKHMRDQMPSIRRINENIPQSVENIIIKSTAKNPKNRYNSVKEMYMELKECLDPSHRDDKRYVYKYLEQDLDDTKIMPAIKLDNVKVDDVTLAKKIDKIDLEEDKVPKKAIISVIVISVLLIGFITFGIINLIPKKIKVPDITIPDLVNVSVDDATRKLKELGFEVETLKKDSEEVKNGFVIRTEPSSGNIAKKGATITIYESIGSEKYVVEDYTGQNVLVVETRLKEIYGLNVYIEKKEISKDSKYTENQIIDQSKKAGTKLTKGDSITLYIPDIVIEYPDMVSEQWTEADAKAFCDKYGISLSINYVETDKVKEGIVVSQSRPQGSKVVQGVTLRIDISTKKQEPEPTPTPNNNDTNNNTGTN